MSESSSSGGEVEESFASLAEKFPELEEALGAIDEELEEGNWTASRTEKKE